MSPFAMRAAMAIEEIGHVEGIDVTNYNNCGSYELCYVVGGHEDCEMFCPGAILFVRACVANERMREMERNGLVDKL